MLCAGPGISERAAFSAEVTPAQQHLSCQSKQIRLLYYSNHLIVDLYASCQGESDTSPVPYLQSACTTGMTFRIDPCLAASELSFKTDHAALLTKVYDGARGQDTSDTSSAPDQLKLWDLGVTFSICCRNDPCLAASELSLKAEQAALSTKAFDTVVTTGIWKQEPNIFNAVPRKVHLEIDVRDTEGDRRDTVIQQIFDVGLIDHLLNVLLLLFRAHL